MRIKTSASQVPWIPGSIANEQNSRNSGISAKENFFIIHSPSSLILCWLTWDKSDAVCDLESNLVFGKFAQNLPIFTVGKWKTGFQDQVQKESPRIGKKYLFMCF